jgi:divalent metal cation (Fe/Co/Zn/Cd) transporter
MEPGALSAGSVALIGFAADSAIEVLSAVALLWRLRTAGADADVATGGACRAARALRGRRHLLPAFGWAWADPVGALLMLPVILWQGWETLDEAREGADDD